ncbi:MAG TPA: GGDEF domain-containing protein [Allosphingosinicella sp.]|nr:GGDEF domain-containing protein [Allosphingosinicella sp.]
MSKHASDFHAAAPIGLTDENELLRAALAEARARIEALEAAAEKDALTGLANGARFETELERVTSQAGRHGAPAALLYIDLRGLKTINARHGRLAGDAALVHVARTLEGLIRASDVLARIGGDLFALILDHLDHDSAIDTAERLARCIAAEPVDLGASLVPVEASVAITAILPGDSVREVMLRAARNLALAREE